MIENPKITYLRCELTKTLDKYNGKCYKISESIDNKSQSKKNVSPNNGKDSFSNIHKI